MKVVTFGEIMLRLSPPDHKRIFQTDSFDVTYGGAEANVAAFLAQMGLDAYFVTKLPNNPLGDAAAGHLRKFGVKTDYIARGGNRIGIYFLEIGASQRPSKVVYDRAHSAISEAKREDFDWEKILDGARWFHFSGITPPLGKELPFILEDALKVAREKGVTVSCDLNYRARLWTKEEAQKVMIPFMEYVDVLIANEEDIEKVLGISVEGLDLKTGKLNRESYAKIAEEVTRKYNFKTVGITLRESISATVNYWSVMVFENGQPHFSNRYEIHIVDRVGAGDSFAGALIYGSLMGFDSQKKAEFAAAASCLKHTIPGDFAVLSIEEIEKLASGATSGRVER
ncbi:sugar kinase [Thermotoga sp. RQ2]|uniref:sugar kinase n=1 Tax=Thermotoga sp. (strain RQ2) TaxID=126740 RepID=UPI0001601D32|nr:sugar kinase [Thermotoga sp. RQ2]ACB09232.1 PfkB domain protein [Thermotoga sp. RQ2]